jgi:outer membrane protein OmpA-like peptidoglycan-associated protein
MTPHLTTQTAKATAKQKAAQEAKKKKAEKEKAKAVAKAKINAAQQQASSLGTPLPVDSQSVSASKIDLATQGLPSAVDLSTDQGLTPPADREQLVSPRAVAAPLPKDQTAGGLTETASGRVSLDSSVSSIEFEPNTDSLSIEAVKTAGRLASILVARGDVRITITAGASTPDGGSPRDARRLSLNRALAVRDELLARGVASSRVDIRALGVNMTGDKIDRVEMRANN